MTIRVEEPDLTKVFEEPRRKCHVCGGISMNDAEITGGGCLWPESKMSKYRGRWYCNPHFTWRFKKGWEDAAHLDIKERQLTD